MISFSILTKKEEQNRKKKEFLMPSIKHFERGNNNNKYPKHRPTKFCQRKPKTSLISTMKRYVKVWNKNKYLINKQKIFIFDLVTIALANTFHVHGMFAKYKVRPDSTSNTHDITRTKCNIFLKKQKKNENENMKKKMENPLANRRASNWKHV